MPEKIRPVAVYLLHFPIPYRGRHHYIGACYQERLATRMNEHAQGRGSQFTRSLARLNHTFTLARVWFDTTWDFETEAKRKRLHTSACTICNIDPDAPAPTQFQCCVHPPATNHPLALTWNK